MFHHLRWALTAVVLAAAGCGGGSSARTACSTAADCGSGPMCVDGVCTIVGRAGPPGEGDGEVAPDASDTEDARDTVEEAGAPKDGGEDAGDGAAGAEDGSADAEDGGEDAGDGAAGAEDASADAEDGGEDAEDGAADADDGGVPGETLWDRTFGGSEGDVAYDVTVDELGNVVVVGVFTGTVNLGGGPRASAGGMDVFVLSLGPDGSYMWDRTFGGENNDAGYGVAADASGNVVVVGHFTDAVDLGGGPRGTAGLTRLFVLSLGPDGSYRWDRTFGQSGYAAAYSVAVDGSGNAAVVGTFTGTVDLGGALYTNSGESDVFVLSLDVDGDYQWDRTFGGDAGAVYRVAMNADGNVAVAGWLSNGADFGGGMRSAAGGRDGLVFSLGPDGSYRWDRTFGGTGDDGAHGVAMDESGDVAVVGWFSGTVDFDGGARTSAGAGDAVVLSLDPDGGYRWDRTFGGTGSDYATGVAVDGVGNLFAVGPFTGAVDFGGGLRTSAGAADVFVLSLGPGGGYRWDRSLGGPDADFVSDVAVDAGGNPFVAGWFMGTADFGGGDRTSAGSNDIFVLSLGR